MRTESSARGEDLHMSEIHRSATSSVGLDASKVASRWTLAPSRLKLSQEKRSS